MKENVKVETVAKTDYKNQAEFIKSVLKNAGYEAYVFEESNYSVLPFLLEGGIKVKVDEKLVAEVKQFLMDNDCGEYVVDD